MMLASETQLLISNIGWALIHFLWQGTLITLAYWVITRSIESIHAKYWTGMCLVLLSLIVPVININSASMVGSSEALLVPLSNTIVSYQQLNLEGLMYYFVNASLPFIVMVWAFTVTLLSVRLIRSWIQLAAIKHQCEPHITNELKQYIKNIAIKLDLPTIPFLKISKQIMVPAAYGVLKPTILLPLSLLSQIPRNQLEAIIKHELCHLKRNDFIHNIIQLFADIVLFFHPGIRWMNNDIRHVREQCCDQMVLAHDTEKLTYAKALTNIAAFTNGMNLKHSVHLGINDGMLLNRVKFLLQNKSSQSSLMVFVPFLLFIVIAIILLQPGQNMTDNSVLAQANTNLLYDTKQNPKLTNQQKFMSNAFYPTLNNRKNETAAPEPDNNAKKVAATAVNSSIPRSIQSTAEITGISKDQLKKDFAESIQLKAFDTTAASVALTPFEPITNRIDSQAASTTIDPEQQAIGFNEISATLPASDLNESLRNTSTSLASFSNINSIKPQFKRYAAPEYPKNFWYNQIEQDVIATFKIQANGRAYDIELSSQKNNYVAFEQAVEKAMKRWKFDISSLNDSTLQRTYQQIFSFNISEEIIRNCDSKTTGTRISKSMPCNK